MSNEIKSMYKIKLPSVQIHINVKIDGLNNKKRAEMLFFRICKENLL